MTHFSGDRLDYGKFIQRVTIDAVVAIIVAPSTGSGAVASVFAYGFGLYWLLWLCGLLGLFGCFVFSSCYFVVGAIFSVYQ